MKPYYLLSLFIGLVGLGIGFLYLPTLSAETNRWYSDEQVKQGEKVFATNCASCHGKNAEATIDWKKRDEKGNLVPPPLNGTAHAWHHPLKILRHTVRKGGAQVGGTMPPFEDKLSADEIDSVIAWFQSKWSDEIYSAWNERNSDTGFVKVKPQKQHAGDPLTQLLRQRLRGADIGETKQTEVEGLYQARVGSDFAYLLSDGRYALIGNLIDLKTGKNLTELAKGEMTLKMLESFPESDMVVFPAAGETQQTLTILTDTDCPFCRKLHQEVPQLQKAGFKVRYIPFPRSGKVGKGYADMKAVWCADDRKAAMNIAKGISSGDIGKGDCEAGSVVDRGYEFGLKIGLRGTPAIILQNGRMLEGYVEAPKLISLSRANQ